MGVHFGNAELIGDGALDPERPELLVYEPKDGQLHLVAVEYIVLAEAWHAKPRRRHRCWGNCFITTAAQIATASQRFTSCTSGPGSTIPTACSLIGTPECRARATRRKPQRPSRQRRTGPVLGMTWANANGDMRANWSSVITSPPARSWSMIRVIWTVFHTTTALDS